MDNCCITVTMDNIVRDNENGLAKGNHNISLKNELR